MFRASPNVPVKYATACAQCVTAVSVYHLAEMTLYDVGLPMCVCMIVSTDY